jgi:surface antigen Omp85-like protein
VRRLALLLLLGAGPLAAQDHVPWRAGYFPYLFGDPNTGLMLVGHYQFARQADYDARVPFDGILSADAGASLHGSWFATARFRAPLLVRGWRLAGDLAAAREDKFGYYGRGPEGANENFDPGAEPADFFRAHRTRYLARAEATRRLRGPVSVAVGVGFEHFRFARVTGPSLFTDDYFDQPLTGTDATGRMSAVVDTRDNEFLPTKGLLLEAGVYGGTGRSEERNIPPVAQQAAVSYVASYSARGYAAGYLHLRGYVSPRAGTVVAGRIGYRSVGRNAPLEARYGFAGWEGDIPVVGGAESDRSFVRGRLFGRNVGLGSVEVRHNLLDVGDYGGITLIAFSDAARAWDSDAAGPTVRQRWKVGGGGGVAVRVLRSALVTINFAGGPDGFTFSMGNGWSF